MNDIKHILTKKLISYTKILEQDPQDLQRANKIIELLSFAEMFKFPIDLYYSQNTIVKLKKEGKLCDNELIIILLTKLNLNLK